MAMPIAMMTEAHHHQRPGRAALEERDLVGADDVDDERLRQQALDEPAGLEQARAVSCRRRRATFQQSNTYSIMRYVV